MSTSIVQVNTYEPRKVIEENTRVSTNAFHCHEAVKDRV